MKPVTARSTNMYSSPSKSFVMETSKAGKASPWRIKVTVDAERQDESGSPAKRRPTRRTVQVPLKGVEVDAKAAESEIEVRRPQRKRKGTPIRRRNGKTQESREDGTTDDAALMPPPPLPLTSSATKARRRRSLKELPTQRSKRLSQAREELDQALQEAVGYTGADENEDGDGNGEQYAGDGDVVGDMTVVGEEDFTMVSVETLQSMTRADTSIVSQRHEGEGDRNAVSVSYMPSSPPKANDDGGEEAEACVRYPNLSDEAREARTSLGQTAYDPRSWKATGLTREIGAMYQVEDEGLDSELSEWCRAREAVSRQIEQANPSQVIVVDDDTVAGADEDDAAEKGVEEEDIWQEEASRSFEDEVSEQQVSRRRRNSRRNQQSGNKSTPPIASPKPNDLFADQPLRPRRSKIPRTWRRTSGADFTYSDSPAHIEQSAPLDVRKRDASTEGGGSRASSGVLTPPSTDDEAHKTVEAGEDVEREENDISLTRPDAEATLLQPHAPAHHNHHAEIGRGREPPAGRKEVASPYSDSSSSVTSPDGEGEDTGMFWQNNLPQLYRRARERPRPQRLQRGMDLSELLHLQKTSSPAKPAQSNRLGAGAGARDAARTAQAQLPRVQQARHSPLRMRAVEGKIKSCPSDGGQGKVVSSPLRKSLLRSSKVGGSPVGKGGSSTRTHTRLGRSGEMVEEEQQESSYGGGVGGNEVSGVDESFASKASDQLQLLGEMAAQYSPRKSAVVAEFDEAALSTKHHEGTGEYEDDEYVDEEEGASEEALRSCEEPSAVDEPSHSYEEHLNVESPQKIRVNFGDTSGNSSLLAPKREYAPLFPSGNARQAPPPTRPQQASPPTITLVSKRSTNPTTSASAQQQTGLFSRLSSNFWSAVVRPTGPTEILPSQANTQSQSQTQTPEPLYPPSLRAHLRSRYGVLRSTHPWTMAHMRTLHRMLNSCSSGKSDSIIPRSGPLPPNLSPLVGRRQKSITAYEYAFSAQHAHVVDAFLQVLVPRHVVQAMEDGEVEMLGDGTASEYRGLMAGRHGKDFVWGPDLGVLGKGEGIEGGFVVRALGDVVCANEETAERERKGAEERRREAEERRRTRGEDASAVQVDGEYVGILRHV